MFGFLLKNWKFIAVLMGAAALWLHGNYTGRVNCEYYFQKERIETQEELFRLANEADRKEAERLLAETERERIALQLEDAAYAEAPTTNCGLPASRVLRLNDR